LRRARIGNQPPAGTHQAVDYSNAKLQNVRRNSMVLDEGLGILEQTIEAMISEVSAVA
jgi:hypothetical protein